MMYSNYAIKHQRDYRLNDAASTKTLQFISETVLKIIFKQHFEKARLWTHGLDA